MIVQMTGELVEFDSQSCVLAVQGIGYELGISDVTKADIAQLSATHESIITLFVRDRTTEQGTSLYGFSTKEERAVFDKLVQIAGVGPKVALSVLSAYSVKALASVVVAKDASALTSIAGVGKKTAERLMVELKDLFASDSALTLEGASAPASSDALAEAQAALAAYGFSASEIQKALSAAGDVSSAATEEILAVALKALGKSVR